MATPSTLGVCLYDSNATTLGETLIDSAYVLDIVYGRYACTPWKWEYPVNLLLVLLFLVGFRWLYDGSMRLWLRASDVSFSLSNQLTANDNPALAIDFSSFLFSMCVITRGSLSDLEPGIDRAKYFYAFIVYQFIGITVLVLARGLNDVLMLRKKKNVKAIVEEKSVAVACVQAGTTVSTALLFATSSGGAESSFGEGVAMTLLYWLIGQVLLLVYGNLVDCITSLPVVHAVQSKLVGAQEIAEGTSSTSDESDTSLKATSMFAEASDGNMAAGVSCGLDLVHAGLLITAPISVGFGILPWLIFVLFSLGVISPVVHLYLDHIIMRGAGYTVNILRHKNWGAAVLMGTLKVLLALVLMGSYSTNCEPGTLYGTCVVKDPDSFVERLGEVTIPDVFTWQMVTNLVILLLLMLFAKLMFFLRLASKDGLGSLVTNARSFSLDQTLADPTNNAVAVSLAAFAFSLGLCLTGVVMCPSANPGVHAAEILLWTVIGALLLLLAFLVNDFVLLMKVSNTKALLENNVAVACYEGGSFMACGIILRSTLIGGGYGYAEGIALTVLYWIVSQVMLLIIAYLYRCITVFDDYDELKKGNAAAGLSGAFTLISLAVIMAYPIPYYSSLGVFVPIALAGIIALLIIRKLVDAFVLSGAKLDKEIVDDQNWGAALVEGGIVLGVAFITNRYVPMPGPPYVSDDIAYFDVCD